MLAAFTRRSPLHYNGHPFCCLQRWHGCWKSGFVRDRRDRLCFFFRRYSFSLHDMVNKRYLSTLALNIQPKMSYVFYNPCRFYWIKNLRKKKLNTTYINGNSCSKGFSNLRNPWAWCFRCNTFWSSRGMSVTWIFHDVNDSIRRHDERLWIFTEVCTPTNSKNI